MEHHCDVRRDEKAGACEHSSASREAGSRPSPTGRARVVTESLIAHKQMKNPRKAGFSVIETARASVYYTCGAGETGADGGGTAEPFLADQPRAAITMPTTR